MAISQRCEFDHFWATVGLYSGKVTFQRCLVVFLEKKEMDKKTEFFQRELFRSLFNL